MVTRNRLGPQALDGPSIAVYGPDPVAGDPRVPAPPSVLSATTSVHQLSGGGYVAAVQLHWTASTTDVDGNPMGQQAVEVWGRKNVTGAAWATLTFTAGNETDTQLDGFKPTETWQFKVRAVSPQNKYSAYSNTVTVLMPKNDPPPLPPSVPTCTSRLGTVNIRWDGLASGGVAMPVDINFVRVERCASATFTPSTAVTQVDQLQGAGAAVDGPLTIDDVWFYRLVAVDLAGQDSQPSGVSASIKVEGIKGPDIPLDVITPGMLSGQVAQTITDAGTAATHAQEAAQNAAKIFSKPTKPTLAVDAMKIGDLWFDTSSGNKPYRYQLVGPPINANDWVSIRDATLSLAFPGGGNLLDGSFLDKDVIHTKFLSAGLIDAKDILVQGSITATSGVIGSLSANDITTGTLSADRIAAGAISASKIFLGDTENLVDEPHFGNDVAWNNGGPPNQIGASVTVTDLPLSGTGKVWQVTGNATIRTVPNTRQIPVAPNDSFYAEGYVRKTATGTTGTVQLLLNIKRKGAVDTSVLLASKVFKTTDAANTWIKLTTVVTTGTVPNVVTTTGVKIPALGYEASLILRVLGDVVSGNVQFGDVMVRRQNGGSLIVDGSITSDQIAAHTIKAGDISGHTITAAEIFGKTITANEIAAGTITANSGVIGTLDASKITTGVMDAARIKAGTIKTGNMTAGTISGSIITGRTLRADRLIAGQITANELGTNSVTAVKILGRTITADKIATRTIKAENVVGHSITGDEIKGLSIRVGHMTANSIAAGSIQSNAVTAAKILAGAVTATKISGDAIDGKTITGATVRTAVSGRRVQMTKTGGLQFYNSSNAALLSLSVATGVFTIRSSTSTAHFQLDNSGFRLYNAANVNTVNLSSSGGATFRGTVTASAINSPTINGATFGGTQSGGTFSSPTISGGGINGTVGLGGIISGGTVRTSGGANRVEISGDQIRLYSGGALGGYVRGDPASSGVNIVPGSTGKSVFIGSGTGGIQVTGNNFCYARGIYNNTASGGAPVYVQVNGWLTRHTSSERYKVNIADLVLAPEFLNIRTATWQDKPNVASINHRVNTRGSDRFTGFLADDLHRVGLTDAVVYDRMARPDSISVPALLAHAVRYIQHLVAQVDMLTGRVAALEGAQT